MIKVDEIVYFNLVVFEYFKRFQRLFFNSCSSCVLLLCLCINMPLHNQDCNVNEKRLRHSWNLVHRTPPDDFVWYWYKEITWKCSLMYNFYENMKYQWMASFEKILKNSAEIFQSQCFRGSWLKLFSNITVLKLLKNICEVLAVEFSELKT